ncbi:conserved hypothetical protein [Neospora caninum Liverpool]|uniref:SAM-dependent methyltransferase RsmB-F/NOP2-type catalytic core domain-containing protein n=1 Tax=Neospora caninum (strain Liverpool) TaxID=572307 RepID=F0VAT5_NEOCL|nr:conserved hypothetical protein [Neospora caninum Liverpool]CBZ51343.1 conserved hypothetical protein [Neospora caninum Liverpool]CEL68660.1 TPA: hypothetical protein BN1204_044080 [Neospora caninum Liverpool]|eukprot:XP_003881376.1 conserved hypothetical protein [Neospora caninum Liverpool]
MGDSRDDSLLGDSSDVAAGSRPFSQQLPEAFAAYLKRNNVDISSFDIPLEIPRYFAVLYPAPALTRAAAAMVQETLKSGDGPAASLVRLLYSPPLDSGAVHGAFPRVFSESLVSAVHAKDCVLHSLDANRNWSGAAGMGEGAEGLEASSVPPAEPPASRRQLPPYEQYVATLLSCIQSELKLVRPPSPVPWLLSNCLGVADELRSRGSAALIPTFPIVFSLPPSVSPRNCTPYRLGLIHPLDAASAAAAAALRPEPGDVVCDLCCAPGNKLVLLANAVAEPLGRRPSTRRRTRSHSHASNADGNSAAPGDSEQSGLSHVSLQSHPEPSFSSTRCGMVVGVEGRRHRGDVCRRIVRRLGARNVLLVLQDGRRFSGGCTCVYGQEGECFRSSKARSGKTRGDHHFDDAKKNGDGRPSSVDTSGQQSGAHKRPLAGGRLSRRKARKRDEASEVPCIDLLAGRDNFVESEGDAPPTELSDGTRDTAAEDAGRCAPPQSGASEAPYDSRSEATQRDCFGKFDKVLVDVECTHDGSLRHMQKFGRQWRWDDFQKKMQMASSAPKACDCRRDSTRPAGMDWPAGFNGGDGSGSEEVAWAIEGLPSGADLPAEDYVKLRRRQRQLLQRGFDLLRPNGLLVYSTCSKCEDQNEQVVRDFLRCNDAAALYPLPCRGLRNVASGEGSPMPDACDGQPAPESNAFWDRCQLLMNEHGSGGWPAVPSSLFLDESLRRHPAAFVLNDTRGAATGESSSDHGASRGGDYLHNHESAEKCYGGKSQAKCRPYRPCSCYFGPEQSGTSGLFLCCITKLFCPDRNKHA